MIYVHYTSFYYINSVVFPEIFTQPDAPCLLVSKIESIGMQYCFTFIKYHNNLLWMMITNWFLMYVYRLITWYKKLGKQQQLPMKVSMRWNVLWPTPHSIYIVADFKRLRRLSVLKHISRRWDYLAWECWGYWPVHEHLKLIHERPRSIHE